MRKYVQLTLLLNLLKITEAKLLQQVDGDWILLNINKNNHVPKQRVRNNSLEYDFNENVKKSYFYLKLN